MGEFILENLKNEELATFRSTKEGYNLKEKILACRESIKVPSLPKMESFYSLPTFQVQKARLENNQLIFEAGGELKKSLKDGFFLLKIPKHIDVTVGDEFCRNFYADKTGSSKDHYRGYKQLKVSGEHQGYHDREHDQWENFFLERGNWKNYFPTELVKLGEGIAELSLTVLKNVLTELDIPTSQWAKLTGGLMERRGYQTLGFNHFRSHKSVRGAKCHRDSGWITIVRSQEPGLVTFYNNELYAIHPKEGYFIINFGSSIEILTELHPVQVKANIHGVLGSSNSIGRHSYVMFNDSNMDGDIFYYLNGEYYFFQKVRDFIDDDINRTYSVEEIT